MEPIWSPRYFDEIPLFYRNVPYLGEGTSYQVSTLLLLLWDARGFLLISPHFPFVLLFRGGRVRRSFIPRLSGMSSEGERRYLSFMVP